MVQDFSEKVQSYSPAFAGFGRGGGKATYPFYYTNSDLSVASRDLLGRVQRAREGTGSGALRRNLPALHPLYNHLHCCRVQTIRGVGNPTKVAANRSVGANGNQRDLAFYARYPLWELTCEFENLPYAVVSDAGVETTELPWFDEDDVRQTPRVAAEWLRFVVPDLQPSYNVCTANYGQQKYRVNGGVDPDGFTYPGAPRIGMAEATLKLTWTFVPYSLVEDTGSPFIRYLGRVNQLSFLGFLPGEMRYDNVSFNRYLPPTPRFSVQAGGVRLSQEFVCDVTFTFGICHRIAEGPPEPANRNWIFDRGWNCRPHFRDGRFYAVTATDGTREDADPTKWRPSYLSFPVQLLFTDPIVNR